MEFEFFWFLGRCTPACVRTRARTAWRRSPSPTRWSCTCRPSTSRCRRPIATEGRTTAARDCRGIPSPPNYRRGLRSSSGAQRYAPRNLWAPTAASRRRTWAFMSPRRKLAKGFEIKWQNKQCPMSVAEGRVKRLRVTSVCAIVCRWDGAGVAKYPNLNKTIKYCIKLNWWRLFYYCVFCSKAKNINCVIAGKSVRLGRYHCPGYICREAAMRLRHVSRVASAFTLSMSTGSGNHLRSGETYARYTSKLYPSCDTMQYYWKYDRAGKTQT